MKDYYDKVYTVLVMHAGACESERDSFVESHSEEPPCNEWRFRGKLGMGGKYRRQSNSVDYYSEDDVTERREVVLITNQHLRNIEL